MTLKTAATLAIAWSTLAAGTAVAAGGESPILNQDQLKWGPAPAVLPAGAELAVLAGDPGKKGRFVIELRGPQGYKVPAHWHSADENVTVISGTFTIGMGDAVAASGGTALTAGGFTLMPKKMHHWASAGTPFVIQVQAMGPFDIHYINPADDPSKTAKKK